MSKITYTQEQLDAMSVDEVKQLLIDEVPEFNKQITKEAKIRAAATEAFVVATEDGENGEQLGHDGDDAGSTTEGAGDASLGDQLSSAVLGDAQPSATEIKEATGTMTQLGELLGPDEVAKRLNERRIKEQLAAQEGKL